MVKVVCLFSYVRFVYV